MVEDYFIAASTLDESTLEHTLHVAACSCILAINASLVSALAEKLHCTPASFDLNFNCFAIASQEKIMHHLAFKHASVFKPEFMDYCFQK